MNRRICGIIVPLLIVWLSSITLCFAEGIPAEDSLEQFFEGSAEQSVAASEEGDLQYYPAKVIGEVDMVKKKFDAAGYELDIQMVEVLVTRGPYKDMKFQAQYQLNPGFNKRYTVDRLTEGDEVLLHIEETGGGEKIIHVAEVKRDRYLLYLVAGFTVALLLVGRMKGVKAVISLALTVVAVIKVLLPAILKGYDPVWLSVCICVVVITLTLLIIGGWNRKTLAAIVGTAGGVVVAGVIALYVGSLAKLTGIGSEESQMLMYIRSDVQLNFKGLLFAGIIIGAMGAIMDVGVSIASAMHEVKENSPDISAGRLIRAGMNVGRDTMATMANTLILAYVGGSLHLILLFMASETPWENIVNWDLISSEILRALAGSTGIVFAIPITALSSALFEWKKAKSDNVEAS